MGALAAIRGALISEPFLCLRFLTKTIFKNNSIKPRYPIWVAPFKNPPAEDTLKKPKLMLTVENVIPKSLFDISGDVHLHESPSTADLKEAPPVNIVQRDQNVYVHFVWKQNGWLGKLLSSSCRYEARVYLEMMGAGEVGNPAPVNISFKRGASASYSAVVTLPAYSLPQGAFKVVATLLMHGPLGPTPIAAFEEVGVLQVYED